MSNSFLIDEIPEYDGDLQEFDEYVNFIDDLWNYMESLMEKRLFIRKIKLKLKGDARLAIQNENFENWSEMKNILQGKLMCSPDSRFILMDKMRNAKQEENESIDAFGNRMIRYKKTYNRSFGGQLSKFIEKENDALARRVFINGIIDSHLRRVVSYAGKETLQEAIAFAVFQTIEFKHLLIEGNIQNECTFCFAKGHTENDCRTKQRQIEYNKHRRMIIISGDHYTNIPKKSSNINPMEWKIMNDYEKLYKNPNVLSNRSKEWNKFMFNNNNNNDHTIDKNIFCGSCNHN